MKNTFFKVSYDELADLLESEWMLYRLQDAGVDNWPGYDEADLYNSDERDEHIAESMVTFEEIEE